MGRPFDFRPDVIFAARMRQEGRCAVLGCDLNQAIEHAHHVVPNQSGKPGDSGDQWLSGVDNCVVLCSACHHRVHGNGNYQSGAVAPPSYFAFSHGKSTTGRMKHQSWAWQVDCKAQTIWDRLSSKSES